MANPDGRWTNLFAQVAFGIGGALILLGWIATPAAAVVLLDTNGSMNISAPIGVADPGFANVGRREAGSIDATAIYLGNRWVITASHVLAGPTDFNGTMYNTVGQSRRITNPNGSATDLLLYRIDGDPGLPSITISDTRPLNNSDVVMIGNGYDRETGLTYWDYNATSDGYDEIGGPSGADLTGYKALPPVSGARPQTIRWGDNKMLNNGSAINTGHGTVHNFTTRFESSGATSNESQAWGGDSGGGVFYDRSGGAGTGWELAGVIVAVGSIGNQGTPPSGTTNAFYGDVDSITFAADMAVYKDKITPLVNHMPGDMNADGSIDADDASLFVTALTNVDDYISQFTFVSNAAQVVEFGDMDLNGVFDLADLSLFNAAASAGSASAQSSDIVPEPSSLLLLVMASLSLWALARR